MPWKWSLNRTQLENTSLPSPWRGVGGEALSPFTLPRKVNGVTTPFDADCTVT